MKVPVRKPAGMKGSFFQPLRVFEGSGKTFKYPADHPRALYKQQKKLLKQMKRA